MKIKSNVALVLSSGGCRGVAHIGVIEELIREGHTISSIAGSSMGAVVGAVYACGNLAKFKQWLCDLDEVAVFELIDFTFTGRGFIKAEKLFKILEQFIHIKTFEELPIPLSVVCTDIVSGQAIVFDKGNLLHAVRASVAIPSIVTPVVYKDMVLVDGGVIAPIPVHHVSRNDNDILVVVDVNANIPYQKPNITVKIRTSNNIGLKRKAFSFAKSKWMKSHARSGEIEDKFSYIGVLDKTFDVMLDKICKLTVKLGYPYLTIEVSKKSASTFEFFRSEELIEAGRMAYHNASQNY